MKPAFTCDVVSNRTCLRISLFSDAKPGARAERLMAAQVYCVAARLEQMAAAEDLDFAVSPNPRGGSVTVELVCNADGHSAISEDVIVEIGIEACSDLGILPRE
jgi:hypothetical protein